MEALGWYNPIEAEDDKKLAFKTDRIEHWLNVGAQLTDNAANLIRKTAPHIIQGQVDRKEAHAQSESSRQRKSGRKV